MSNASSATDPLRMKLVELERGSSRTNMNAEVWCSWGNLDVGPLWKVLGKPVLKASDRGRKCIDYGNDDALVDLEVEIGKVSEEGE